MKNCLFLGLFAITLISCEKKSGMTEFYFDNPQPINDSELSSIPSKFIGVYSDEEGSYLNVSESMILKEYNAAYHKSIIDSIGVLKNGKLTTNDTHEVLDAEIKGDSVYLKGLFRDTIFKFSPTKKAKRINGDLVISHKDSIFWRANIMTLKNDSLKIKYLSDREDYNQIQCFVKDIKINDDTTFVRINPTRREFSKILKI